MTTTATRRCTPRRAHAALLPLAALALLPAGCASDRGDPRLEEVPPATLVDARPAAFVDGMSVSWGDLRPGLSEIAGADALRELVLDRRVAQAFQARGEALPPGAESAERRRLLESLDDDADRAIRTLDEIRRQERLGPHRFRMLMRRNAMLRAMVADEVELDDALLRTTFDRLHGPRRQGRLITVTSLDDAVALRRELAAGAAFGDLAVEHSTDSSAARGGLLEPIARRDPAYPAALREALWSLEESGAVSDPVRIDRGYALLRLERELPGSDRARGEPQLEAELRRAARTQQERLLMDRLASELMRDAVVRPIDEHLEFAWRAARPRR